VKAVKQPNRKRRDSSNRNRADSGDDYYPVYYNSYDYYGPSYYDPCERTKQNKTLPESAVDSIITPCTATTMITGPRTTTPVSACVLG
jgi:hypothetical protein